MEKLGLVYEDGTEDSVDFVVKTWCVHSTPRVAMTD